MKHEHRVLVLTDLVDSTSMVAALGDRRAGAINAKVDRITRDLLSARGGLEIDKTDGFLLLFTSAPAALGFAVELHDALAALGTAEGVALAMRVGVHAGTVGIRENPPADVARGAKPLEVEGLAKPLAARVMSLAVGFQTLCTESVERKVDHPESGALAWVDHGAWRLKGVPEPVPLAEVGRPGLAPLRPPPDSAKAWRAASGPLAAPREATRRALSNTTVRGLLLSGLAVVVTAAAVYWDQTRLKTSEFAAFEWSASGPVGVGEPQPLQPRYRVTTRGGLVRKLEHITPSGTPVAQVLPTIDALGFGAGLLDEAYGAEPNWVHIDSWRSHNAQQTSVMEVERSDSGKPTELVLRHPAGAVQERVSVESAEDGLRLRWLTPYGVPSVSGTETVSVEDLRFDDAGRLAERRFLNVSGLQAASSVSGVFGERLERDGTGRVTSRAWLDEHGEPLDDAAGVAKVALRYHGDSTRTAEIQTFNQRGEPVADEDGCARITFSSDGSDQRCFDARDAPELHYSRSDGGHDLEQRAQLDNPVRWHRRVDRGTDAGAETDFFDVEGALVATLRREIDADGHLRTMALFDPSGAPAPSAEVWSAVTLEIAPDGRHLSSPRFRDLSGRPYLVRDGMSGRGPTFVPIYRRAFSYDETGELAALTFVDLAGHPSTGAHGWSTIRATRDAAGRSTRVALFAPDGEATETTQGVHRLEYVIDDVGRPTEVARFAADGAPATDTFDSHRDVMEWDAQGRLVSYAAFGANGPVDRPPGDLRGAQSHRVTVEYSPQGKASELSYFTADGTPGRVDAPDQCVTEQLWFDHAGRHSGLACFGPQGEPMTYPAATHHKRVMITGPHGVTSTRYLDTDGSPIANLLGCERWDRSFDARGRDTALECLTDDGRPMGILGSDAVSVHFESFTNDRPALEETRDRAGRPVSVGGRAPSTMHGWTDRGELATMALFDADGEPFEDGGVSSYEITYDARGAVASMVRRDAAGEVLAERGDVRVKRNGIGTPLEWRHHDRSGGLQWRLAVEVDAAQRTTAATYLNDDGGTVDGAQGWAAATYAYDDRVVTAAYRDAQGLAARLRGPDTFLRGLAITSEQSMPDPKNVATDWGFGVLETEIAPQSEGRTAWSGWRLTVDEHGQPVERTYLDAEGSPVVPDDPGYATQRTEWRAQAPVRVRYFDADGQPMVVCGVAEVAMVDGVRVATDLEHRPIDIPPECEGGGLGVRHIAGLDAHRVAQRP